MTALTAVDAATESPARRSVSAVVAEIEGQRAQYATQMRGAESETRQLLSKMAALDAILDSPAVQRGG